MTLTRWNPLRDMEEFLYGSGSRELMTTADWAPTGNSPKESSFLLLPSLSGDRVLKTATLPCDRDMISAPPMSSPRNRRAPVSSP